MKKDLIQIGGMIYTIGVILVTTLFTKIAFAERGCFEIGGEYALLVTIPIVWLVLFEIIQNMEQEEDETHEIL